jgi:hypothetical protein
LQKGSEKTKSRFIQSFRGRNGTTERCTNEALFFDNAARTLYGKADGAGEYSTVLSPENKDDQAALSREDQSAASDMRGTNEIPDDEEARETSRRMIDARLRF